MQYICTVCGYMYDDDLEAVPFSELPDDWTCPLCGASKDLFEAVVPKEKKVVKEAKAEAEVADEQEPLYAGYTAKELSVLFSSLANGCEKQYEFEAQAHFNELSAYFDGLAVRPVADVDRLRALLKADTALYDEAKEACKEDRGALRALTWGEKVTKIEQMVAEQKGKDQNIFVCSVCGFIFVGDEAPKLCPVCKVPDWKFVKF